MINAISAEFVHRRFSPSLMSALEIKTLIEWRTKQSESHLAIVKRTRWALVTTLITRQAVQIHAQRITEVHHRIRHKKARTGFFSVSLLILSALYNSDPARTRPQPSPMILKKPTKVKIIDEYLSRLGKTIISRLLDPFCWNLSFWLIHTIINFNLLERVKTVIVVEEGAGQEVTYSDLLNNEGIIEFISKSVC